MYSGLPGEGIIKTRVRMYQKKKIKTSLTLISDEESIVQHLERSDLQCFIWKQYMKQNMIIPKLEGRGWYMKDRKDLPVWCVGEQLPPSFTKIKTKNRLIVQNMQINLMLLMMAMLMMTMMIIYPGKKGPRFVLSHN